MFQFRVFIYAQDAANIVPIYCERFSASNIVDAHLAGDRLVERFNAHRPIGTHFFVLVSDVDAD